MPDVPDIAQSHRFARLPGSRSRQRTQAVWLPSGSIPPTLMERETFARSTSVSASLNRQRGAGWIFQKTPCATLPELDLFAASFREAKSVALSGSVSELAMERFALARDSMRAKHW